MPQHLCFDDEEREDEQTPRVPSVSNPMSHRHQKKNIQKQYAAARRGQRTEENTAKAAKRAGRSFREKAVSFVKEYNTIP